jgi:hypothetical protein
MITISNTATALKRFFEATAKARVNSVLLQMGRKKVEELGFSYEALRAGPSAGPGCRRWCARCRICRFFNLDTGKTEDMNTKSHPDSDVDANNENRHGDCTDPEQSPSTVRYLSKRIG